MADLLTSELVRSGNFVVVERQHLDKVLGEISRQKAKHFRAEGKVADGRLKNAHYLIRGVINDFSQIGGGSLFVIIRNLFLRSKGNRARVALTLTVVNVESGEIVNSLQCGAMAYATHGYAKGRYRNVDFGGDAFLKTPLGVATVNAIRRGVRGVVKKVPRTYWEPMIADVSGRRIILNGGRNRGYKAGQQYEVRGSGKPVTDPVTGDLLSIIPGAVVGTIRITQANEKIAYGQILRGTAFQRGQRLKRIKPEPVDQ